LIVAALWRTEVIDHWVRLNQTLDRPSKRLSFFGCAKKHDASTKPAKAFPSVHWSLLERTESIALPTGSIFFLKRAYDHHCFD
jgi:hypothetical protein